LAGTCLGELAWGVNCKGDLIGGLAWGDLLDRNLPGGGGIAWRGFVGVKGPGGGDLLVK
jgi:hypothetical protein